MTRIAGLTGATLPTAPTVCHDCIWWQSKLGRSTDKRKWILGTEEEWGAWGTVYYDDDGRLLGSMQYGPSDLFPRAAELPAGPASGDAVLVTCAYLLTDTQPWVEQSLFLAAIGEARDKGARALEAFAGAVKGASGSVVVLASGRASTESLALVKQLVAGKSATLAVQVPVSKDAEKPLKGVPDLALRQERAPNGTGAEWLGYARDWRAAVTAAKSAGLVIVVGAFAGQWLARRARGLMPLALVALALAFAIMLLFGGMELDRGLLLLAHGLGSFKSVSMSRGRHRVRCRSDRRP